MYNNAVVKCHWATVCKTVRPMLSDRCQSVCLYVGILWPNGCIDQDVTWYGGRLRRRPHCVRWGPERGTPAPPPLFGSRHMSVVAKRSHISVTAELFFLNDRLLLSSLVGNIRYTVIPPAGVRPVKVFGKKWSFQSCDH